MPDSQKIPGAGTSGNAPTVSVIVPTYNRKEYLRPAVESVLSQSFTDHELIVVDDGSTDGTDAVVARYAAQWPGVRYVRQQNRGVAAARNRGIALARGEFVCFLDSDDIWKPHKLQTQLQFARANPQYAIYASDIDSFHECGIQQRCAKQAMYPVREGNVLLDLLFHNWIQTSTVMARRSLLENVGGFDEAVGQFAEDWVLWMRLAARGPVHFHPEALVFYRAHPASLTSQDLEAQYRSLMLAVDCVAALPGLQERTDLVRQCRHRISMIRAMRDLHARRFRCAREKFRDAIRTSRDDWRARFGFLACGLLCRF
ncbi:MAG: glycosyltransferase family 2 protein [Acidobacteriaceae bacterium]